jgi:hypothetical protein
MKKSTCVGKPHHHSVKVTVIFLKVKYYIIEVIKYNNTSGPVVVLKLCKR